jgi:threonine dehydrogenase-like Zn-dependent dehydrogenase
MRALTVLPGVEGSGRLEESFPEPEPSEGPVLVATLAVGICGTDHEILSGGHGEAPPGQQRLVLGHESVGRVVEAPGGGVLSAGDLVVAMVRRPDPVPCANCAAGEWDMCRNGRYTEHGIKGLHGFARERFRARPGELVKVDPELGELAVLLEPTSILAKAWEHIERIGSRAVWAPTRVLVTGAGPVGLLAAMLGVQRGLEVHVLDQVTDGPKPALVEALGARYHCTPAADLDLTPDVVVECTGAGPVIAAVLGGTARNAIVCLTGVSSPGRPIELDVGRLNREWVLDNDVVFGSVNANRRHYEAAAQALARADQDWLSGLVTRRVPLTSYAEALEVRDADVKTVLTF